VADFGEKILQKKFASVLKVATFAIPLEESGKTSSLKRLKEVQASTENKMKTRALIPFFLG